MTTHWNVLVNIQRVEEAPLLQGPDRRNLLNTGRKVVKLLEVAVSAASEQEAYAKAHRLLQANQEVEDPLR